MEKKSEKFHVTEDLFSSLKLLHNQLRIRMKTEWNRVLPFEELLFDRWEKANFLNAKKGTSIYHNSYIFGKVEIGKSTWVGPFTLLDGSGGKLKVGDFCSISSGVQIYTHNTVNWALTGGKAAYEKKSTNIGNHCYIGPYSVITMGVRIGKCSVIGAHSLVNSNIPSHSIAFGVPARVVGRVEVKGRYIKYHYFDRNKKANETKSRNFSKREKGKDQ